MSNLGAMQTQPAFQKNALDATIAERPGIAVMLNMPSISAGVDEQHLKTTARDIRETGRARVFD